jgi:ADP-ribose pyrophosphatase
MTKREILHEGRYIRLVNEGGWEWAERTNASGVVVVLGITQSGCLLLVEQHRPPVGGRVVELPAGLSGDIAGQEEEDLAVAAARELEEETGYRPGRVERLFSGPVSAGMTSETLTFFRADDLVKVGGGGGDASEDITVHAIPLAEVPAFLHASVARGALVDPKVWAGLWFAHTV